MQRKNYRFWNFASLFSFVLVFFSYSANAQKTGEENFKALCVACHQISDQNLVGPGLLHITDKRDEKWLISFIQSSQSMVKAGDADAIAIFEEFNKIPMPDQALTEAEVKDVLAYIAAESAKSGEATADADGGEHGGAMAFLENHHSELPTSYTGMFILAVVLIVLATVDMIFTRVLKARFIHVIVALVGTYMIMHIMYRESRILGYQKGYSPDQPIAFSHKVHAGDNGIDCKYCHVGVFESRHSGIPPTSLCLNCHNTIRSGANTGTEEIAKIHEAVNSGKQIEWIKVHNLPDHVYFNHSQHVVAGGLDCVECHGDVANMGRIQQVNDLGMGWCISCHRTKEVKFDNEYYKTFTKLHEEYKNGTIDKVTVEDVGGTDCVQCHY